LQLATIEAAMKKSISRETIDEDLFLVLKTIFHYERIIANQYGLDFEEIYTLQFLRRKPSANVTDLSDELKLPLFTISRMVSRLQASGFLSKVKDVADKRVTHLNLETAGEEALKTIEAASYKRITTNIANMDEDKVNQLLNAAQDLHMVLGVTENVIHK
jgi:DNA-binding MarR family transcriptional regulator